MLGLKPNHLSEPLVLPGDLIPDGRLANIGDDRLDHGAIARSVGEIALSTDAPTNIALFGHWGAGKSSIFTMVKTHIEELTRHKTSVVRYDAWKYGGKELKRNFIETVAHQLDLGEDTRFNQDLHEVAESTDLHLGQWVKRNWRSLILGVLGAAVIAAVCLFGLAGATTLLTQTTFNTAMKASVTAAGTVFGLALVAVLVGPKVLESAVVKVSSSPPSGDDQFATRFAELVTRVRRKGAKRLVVFIDELDRCAPEDVVATLVDLKTFLDQPDCVFIVAADKQVIEHSLQKVPQAKPVRQDEPYYATPGAFLDKIFQYQIALPPLRPRALTRFARTLVEEQSGIWAEMREYDSELFEAVVFTLIPVHVRSPRRVKILLNDFAANCRIAQARGIAWIDRAREIAVLSVLETEFPDLAKDLLRFPRLLRLLRSEEEPDSEELRNLVAQYMVGEAASEADNQEGTNASSESGPVETIAGNLLSEGPMDQQDADARATLKRQLSAYLSKIGAADIPDPKPDLFYIQSAGRGDGLADPRLGDAVDFASDTAPEDVLAAFDEQPSKVLAAAVRLIVAEGEYNYGPGKMLAFESAGRLAERMDIDDLRDVSNEAAPAILAERANPNFPIDAIPGAITLGMLAGSNEPVAELITRVGTGARSDELLSRIANTLPYATWAQTQAVKDIISGDYVQSPAPLHQALSSLPIQTAIDLWEESVSLVSDALIELEQPPPSVPEAANQPAGAARQAGNATQLASTGKGRARLRDLLTAVQSRTDGELLISKVFMAVQEIDHPDIRAEVNALATDVVGGLTDECLIIKHVLIGIETSPSEEWAMWDGLLPAELNDHGCPVGEHSSRIIVDQLLPCLSLELNSSVLDSLSHISDHLATLATPDKGADIHTALKEELTSKLTWSPDGEIPGLTVEIRIHQRATAHEVASSLRDIVGSQTIDEILANDVFSGVETINLDETSQEQLLRLIDDLTAEASRQLSTLLDEYEPTNGEANAIVRLKVRSRLKFSGDAPPKRELAELTNDAKSSSIAVEWLGLNPAVDDAVAIRSQTPIPAGAFRNYASNLSIDERTRLWIRLEADSVDDGILRAIGQFGIDAEAVEHMENGLLSAPKLQDRNQLVGRLLTATITPPHGTEQARRAACDLTKALIERNTGGDTRLAAEVIIWADGAIRGQRTAIRSMFDDALQHKGGVLPKSLLKDLKNLGLITPNKKGPLGWLFGD